jgi:hypothetical protein
MTPSSGASHRFRLILSAGLLLAGAAVFAQFGGVGFGGGGGRSRGWGGSGEIYVGNDVKVTRDIPGRTVDVPMWENPKGFDHDSFVFARLRFDKAPGMGRGGGGWTTDLPDADLNLSFRLQQMTSIKVDPNGRVLRATDPELANYPFLFAAAPNSIWLSPDEILGLRNYLLNGGCMILTDYWGDQQLNAVESLFRQVLPSLKFIELQLDHPLYRAVFPIEDKGQVPQSDQGKRLEFQPDGPTWEDHGGDSQTVHHRALFDEKGRLLVLGIHNSDHSDGWEREGESDYYFHRFSEKIAYPLAINTLVYMMTH